MPTNELPAEKRIAANLPIPEHPPVPDPEIMEHPEPGDLLGEPPRTRLLLEGFDPEEITADFLLGIHDLADEHGLSIDSISVGQPGPDDR